MYVKMKRGIMGNVGEEEGKKDEEKIKLSVCCTIYHGSCKIHKLYGVFCAVYNSQL